eukprot:1300989-Rhodomonas_salina.1
MQQSTLTPTRREPLSPLDSSVNSSRWILASLDSSSSTPNGGTNPATPASTSVPSTPRSGAHMLPRSLDSPMGQ